MSPDVSPSSAAPRGITFQPDIYPKVLGLLPPPGARVLDVGAGEGYFSRVMAGRGYRVEACDYDARGFRCPEIPFHAADLNERIPFPDGVFDAAVSIEVLEHLENHARFVRETLRVVRPGGWAIFTTPNVLSFPSRWHYFLFGYTDCAPRPLDPSRPDSFLLHINPISLPELMFWIERSGGILDALETNRLRRNARIPYLLLAPLLRFALRRKLIRKEYAGLRALYERHLRWVTHPANLMGRITIARAVKKTCPSGDPPPGRQ